MEGGRWGVRGVGEGVEKMMRKGTKEQRKTQNEQETKKGLKYERF